MKEPGKLSFGRINIQTLKQVKFNWEFLIYPFLFQDDIYAIAYDFFVKTQGSKKNLGYHNKYSIVVAKRLICRTRYQDHSEILYLESQKDFVCESEINPYLDALTKGVCLVLEISLFYSLQFRTFIEWKFFRSIQSIFFFMEDKVSQSDFLSKAKIPYLAHPETLTRMFRRRIRDVSFLHLLRSSLYISRNLPFYSSARGGRSMVTPLWNFYICETEFLSSHLWKRFRTSRSNSFVIASDQKSITRKEKGDYKYHSVSLNRNILSVNGACIHYVRYKNDFLFIIVGTKDSIKKWIYHISTFIQFNFHCWFHSHQIYLKKITKGSISLLGYTVSVRSKYKNVRTVVLGASYSTVSITKDFSSEVSTSLLIKFMMKRGFCNSVGRPVSRLDWTTLADGEIINRFLGLWRVLYLYYSGSRNRSGLRKLRYISKFSCDKTLACKHKTTTRLIRCKFNSGILLENFLINPEISPLSHFCNISNSNMQSFWHMDVIRPVWTFGKNS
uniref:intron maturase n=1 Tax=Anemia phyllitidis TaxID=12940 RepID=UPI0021AC4B10|nr:intron maturase [Anemia phyllitidis]UUL71051.1 intron maturase [Anemia phyllitidis]